MMFYLCLPRDVKQVDAHEDDHEATYERDAFTATSGIESLEENG